MRREEMIEYRAELVKAMQRLAAQGYRCFILKENASYMSYMYGYIITPNGTIIYVQRDEYQWRGWTFTIRYKGGANTGTGCQCLEEPVNDITQEILERAEKEGLAFARRLKAVFYESAEAYIQKELLTDSFEEIEEV